MKKFDTLNVIPFIDIMLVLLAIVLASASFINQSKIDIDIPESSSNNKISSQDLVEIITVTEDGTYFYKEKQVSLIELNSIISTFNSDSFITLKVDSRSNFQFFISVTEILQHANLDKVSVLTTYKSSSMQQQY